MARRRITPLEFDDATEVGAVPARDDTAREGSELPTVSAEGVVRTTDTSAIATLPDGGPVPDPVSGANGSDQAFSLPPPPVSGLPPEFSVEGAPPSSLADATMPMQTLSALKEETAPSAFADATVPLQVVSRLKRKELPSLSAPPPPSDNLPSEGSQEIKLPAAIDYAPPHLALGGRSSSRPLGAGDTIEQQVHSSEIPTADTGDVAHPVTLPSVPSHPATAARSPAPELSGAFQSYEENDDVHALPTEALPLRPTSTSQSDTSAFQSLEKAPEVSPPVFRPPSLRAPGQRAPDHPPTPWAPVTPSSPGLPAANVSPLAPTPTPTVQNSSSPSAWAPDGGGDGRPPPTDLSASGVPQLLADEVFDDADELSQSNIVEQVLPAETGQWTAPVAAAPGPAAAVALVAAPPAPDPPAESSSNRSTGAAPSVDAELLGYLADEGSGEIIEAEPPRRRSGCGLVIAAGIGFFLLLAVVGGGIAAWYAIQNQDAAAGGFLAGILDSVGAASSDEPTKAVAVVRTGDDDAPPIEVEAPVDDDAASASNAAPSERADNPAAANAAIAAGSDKNSGAPGTPSPGAASDAPGRTAESRSKSDDDKTLGVRREKGAVLGSRSRIARGGDRRKGQGTYLFRARTSSYSARKGLNRSVRATLKAAKVSLLTAPPSTGFDLLLRASAPRIETVDSELVVEIDCRLRVREQPSGRIRRSMSATGVARGPKAKRSALEAEAAENCGKDLAGSAAALINDG